MARGFVFQVAKDASTKDVFCAEYYFGMEDDVGCDYFCDLDSTEAAKRCIYDFLKSLEEKVLVSIMIPIPSPWKEKVNSNIFLTSS